MMTNLFKRVGALLLCMTLLLSAALAEDSFTIDVDALDLDRLSSDDYVAGKLSGSTQGIRVRKAVSASSEVASAVRLTLTEMDTRTVVFDKNYGFQSGVFDSGVIYLPYVSGRTVPYLITLYVGDYVYGLPFMHLQRRMESNSACTAGVRLRELDPAQSSDWVMGTMLDLDELRRGGSRTVDVCASNSYLIGTAVIALRGDELQVELRFSPSANVETESAELYVITDGNVLSTTRPRSLGSGADVSGASAALVYLDLIVSYDPAGLPSFRYREDEADAQQRLWNEVHESRRSSSGSSGSDASFEAPADSGWDDGWSSGWDDGWSSGW